MSDESGPPDTRPPSKPPTNPPPPKPSYAGHQLPARQVTHSQAAVGDHDDCHPGGPGFTTPQPLGPPRFAVISHGRGGGPPQVGDEVLVIPLGEPEPVDDWRYTVPRFAEGEHRLVGQVVEASGKNPRPQSRPPKARPYGSQPLNPATPYRKP